MACLPTWRGCAAVEDPRRRAELLDVRRELIHGQEVDVRRFSSGVSGSRRRRIPDGLIKQAHDAEIRHRRTVYEPTRELCYDGLPRQKSMDHTPGGELRRGGGGA